MFSVIDTATPQRNLDLSIPFGQGYRTNYVKLGGDNVPRYVAPHYVSLVDRSRALGYRVGHYWVPSDAADPAGAADYFADNLRGWTSRDFVVLDNESLDGARLYSDGQAARWVERVKARLGIPGRQVFVYYGLADARARTHDAVLATGANFIIAAYSYAAFTFDTPSNIPRERVVGHQTGGVVFGGVATDVNTFTDNAFDYGVTMEDQMRQFIAANRKPADAATWDQMCGSLMFRFNSWRGWTSWPVRDISSAFRASKGSTIISTDFTRAPVGAFHFFDIGGPGNGHVMQDARGGGLVCLSTGYALSESLGSAIGFQSVPGYVAAKGARYLGWSKDYAGGTINVSGLAGLGAELIEEEEDLGDTMKYINVVGGGRGTVGELTFTPYTADTHGAWADTYAAVASTHFDGEDVDEITFNVLRQDALNRQAQLVAVVRAATGGNVGDIADTIKAELRAAVTEALDGFTVDADISDEAASNIGQIAADRVIERIVSGLAS